MIAKLSHIIADFFIRQNIIQDEHREIYEYGFELSISSLLGILIVVAIGLLSGKFWESVVFYMVFCITRIFTGGFHASSHLLCKITFTLVLLIILISDWMLQGIESYYWFVLYFYSVIIICQFSPVENSNKELSERQKVKCKVIAMILMAVWLAVMFLFRVLNSKFDHIIALTLFCVSNLILLGIHKERRKQK